MGKGQISVENLLLVGIIIGLFTVGGYAYFLSMDKTENKQQIYAMGVAIVDNIRDFKSLEVGAWQTITVRYPGTKGTVQVLNKNEIGITSENGDSFPFFLGSADKVIVGESGLSLKKGVNTLKLASQDGIVCISSMDDTCDYSAYDCVDKDMDTYDTCDIGRLDGDTLPADCNDNPSQGVNIHPDADEVCNRIDDNCDGIIDNDAEGNAWDADRDGFPNEQVSECIANLPPGQLDCNDNNASIFPGAPELCDDLDNNCDVQNLIDDNVPVLTCGNANGAFGWCASGTATCNEGSWTCDRDGQDIPENNLSACQNDIDDDCDGLTDQADLQCLPILKQFGNFVASFDTVRPAGEEFDADVSIVEEDPERAEGVEPVFGFCTDNAVFVHAVPGAELSYDASEGDRRLFSHTKGTIQFWVRAEPQTTEYSIWEDGAEEGDTAHTLFYVAGDGTPDGGEEGSNFLKLEKTTERTLRVSFGTSPADSAYFDMATIGKDDTRYDFFMDAREWYLMTLSWDMTDGATPKNLTFYLSKVNSGGGTVETFQRKYLDVPEFAHWPVEFKGKLTIGSGRDTGGNPVDYAGAYFDEIFITDDTSESGQVNDIYDSDGSTANGRIRHYKPCSNLLMETGYEGEVVDPAAPDWYRELNQWYGLSKSQCGYGVNYDVTIDSDGYPQLDNPQIPTGFGHRVTGFGLNSEGLGSRVLLTGELNYCAMDKDKGSNIYSQSGTFQFWMRSDGVWSAPSGVLFNTRYALFAATKISAESPDPIGYVLLERITIKDENDQLKGQLVLYSCDGYGGDPTPENFDGTIDAGCNKWVLNEWPVDDPLYQENKWYFMTITWSKTLDEVTIHAYINGVPLLSSMQIAMPGERWPSVFNDKIVVGHFYGTLPNFDDWAPGRFAPAAFDEVKTYKYARSPAQVDADYTAYENLLIASCDYDPIDPANPAATCTSQGGVGDANHRPDPSGNADYLLGDGCRSEADTALLWNYVYDTPIPADAVPCLDMNGDCHVNATDLALLQPGLYENFTDGIDNDCDYYTDEEDPDAYLTFLADYNDEWDHDTFFDADICKGVCTGPSINQGGYDVGREGWAAYWSYGGPLYGPPLQVNSYSAVDNIAVGEGTLEFWIKPLLPMDNFWTTPGEKKMLFSAKNGAQDGIQLFVVTEGATEGAVHKLNITTVGSLGNQSKVYNLPADFNVTKWHHVAMTWKKVNQIYYVVVSVDGYPRITQNVVQTKFPTDLTSFSVGLSENAGLGSDYANAMIDNLKIFSIFKHPWDINWAFQEFRAKRGEDFPEECPAVQTTTGDFVPVLGNINGQIGSYGCYDGEDRQIMYYYSSNYQLTPAQTAYLACFDLNDDGWVNSIDLIISEEYYLSLTCNDCVTPVSTYGVSPNIQPFNSCTEGGSGPLRCSEEGIFRRDCNNCQPCAGGYTCCGGSVCKPGTNCGGSPLFIKLSATLAAVLD